MAETIQTVITVPVKVTFTVKPIIKEHLSIIRELTQEELDNDETLKQYIQDYYTPLWYEIVSITWLENL